MKRYHWLKFLTTVAIAAGFCATGEAEEAIYERAPINYLTVTPGDPVARLFEAVKAGKVEARFDAKRGGYLEWLLGELRIPVSSQVLVFSKTSFQRELISPERPRALYFNDDVYVGFVSGGDVLEITATDPANGPMYYSLRQSAAAGGKGPALVRQSDACLQCHASAMTSDLPGHIVRSVYPDARGQAILSAGSFRTNHTSPLKQRWGGWYVTGTSGEQKHMGNVVSPDRDSIDKTDFTAGTNLTSLAGKFERGEYLSGHSDIVALMVMEHQAYVHNMMTRANYLTRAALHEGAEMNKVLGRPAEFRSESMVSRIKNACEPLVKALLMSEEAGLTGPIRGTSGFAEQFAAAGPRDKAGRSLRELDLNRRIFKYPLSYLIYSPSFDQLPAECRDYVYGRLREVLTGKDTTAEFSHLSAEDRRAIREILVQTKKGLGWGG